jgi:hypothetical protein
MRAKTILSINADAFPTIGFFESQVCGIIRRTSSPPKILSTNLFNILTN